MNDHEFSAQLRRLLDGFGAYDRRHTAEVFSELPRRRGRDRSWVLAACACIIAAAVVATLLLPGLLPAARPASPRRPAPVHSDTPAPSATPQPSTLVVQGAPWVKLDWSGNRVGSFQLPILPGGGYIQESPSPDGTMVVAQSFRGGMVLVDAGDGHVVGTPPRLGRPGDIGQPALVWSDDSRHVCALSRTASDLELMVAQVDPRNGEGAVRGIHVPGVPADGVTSVDACSFRADRAVISESQGTGSNGTAVVVVIRLSDGRVLLHHGYPAPAPFVNVNASADGRFLVGFGAEQPATKSVVVDLATGDVVAHIDGVGMAFSADDRYLAVSSLSSEVSRSGQDDAGRSAAAAASTSARVPGKVGNGSLLDWRAGHRVWQGPGQLEVLAVQPDGEAIAVLLYTRDVSGGLLDQWLIVRPDGSAISFKNQAMQP
jgi:hypothetical protein